MRNITWKHIGLFVLIAASFFVLDRVAKEYVLRVLDPPFIIIPDFFSFVSQENPGIAFGIRLPFIIQLLLIPILLIVGMKILIDTIYMERWYILFVVGVVVGGALSNFVDRLIYGAVIDYIAIWKYPVFNIADMGIVIGIFILFIFYDKIKRVN
jgi:signal peptidase II